MEDGKQIARRIEASKQIFLEEIQKEITERERYSVQDELERASKNKNWRVIIIIGVTIICFSFIVLIMNNIVTQRYENAHIDITTFQNINLREILNITKQLERQVSATIVERNEVIAEKNLRQETLNEQLTQSIIQLENMNLSSGELSSRIIELRTNHEDALATLNAQMDSEINILTAKLNQLQQNLSEYDMQQLEGARRQEEILANERRLFTLELNQLKETYESTITRLTNSYEQQIAERNDNFSATLESTRSAHRTELANTVRRYNPTLSGIRNLLRPSTNNAEEQEELVAYASLQTNQYLSTEGVAEQMTRQDEYKQVLQALKDIPYQNDVPLALAQLGTRYEDSILAYQGFVSDLSNRLTAKINSEANLQDQISRIMYAFQSYSEQNRENGYIIDARDDQDIMIYIDRFVPLGEESIGYVSRGLDDLVGTISFLPFEGYMRASLTEYVGSNTDLQPFDTIIITWDDTGNANSILERALEGTEESVLIDSETPEELDSVEQIIPESERGDMEQENIEQENIEAVPEQIIPLEEILPSTDIELLDREEIPPSELEPSSEEIESIQEETGDDND